MNIIRKTEFQIFLFIFFLVSLCQYLGIFESIEVKTIDARYNAGASNVVSKDVVIVAIDESCLLELGNWPWPRSYHARVIENLSKWGAKVIAFDVLFTEPAADPAEDEALVAAVERAGNVICAVKFSPRQMLSETTQVIEDYYLEDVIPPLKKVLASTGFINIDYESMNVDGVVRNVHLIHEYNGRLYNSLPFEAARIYKGVRTDEVSLEYGRIVMGKDSVPVHHSNIIKDGEIKSLATYLVSYEGSTKAGVFNSVSYADVYFERVSGKDFRGKAVIVGAQTSALHDIKVTPMGTMPGTEVNANIIRNLIEGRFVYRTGFFTDILLILLMSGLCYFYLIFFPPRKIDLLLWLLATLIYVGVSFVIFIYFRYLIEIVSILVAFTSVFVLVRFYQMFIGLMKANAELMEANRKLDQKVTELGALYDISRTINVITDMKQVFEVILKKAVEVIHAERGSLLMMDEDSQELAVEVVYGVDRIITTQPVRLKVGEGIAGMVAKKGEALIVNRGWEDERFKTLFERDKDIRSILCVPLFAKQNVPIGVLNLTNKESGGEFDENDAHILTVIASQAASAIENTRLYRLAVMDGLTGLYVRRYFQGRLTQELKRVLRYGGALSLIMTDIDHFKKFNDTYGHQQGDIVLSEVAAIFRTSIRESDLAARYGGEEFAIILPETPAEGARTFGERLRKRVEEHEVPGQEKPLRVTISLGVASYEAGVRDIEELIRRADTALYYSKRTGRNRVSVYSGAEMKGLVTEEASIH